MRQFRRYLLPGLAAIWALLWISDQAFNFRDLLRMSTPPWFWSVIFAALFFISIIGAVVIQGREVERLKETSPPAVQAQPRLTLAERIGERAQIGRNIVEGLERTQGHYVSQDLLSTIWQWGRGTADVLAYKYAGDAAFFRSELPSTSSYDLAVNVRGKCLAYMNQRLQDLERLIAREGGR
jgi:hypothetical protein